MSTISNERLESLPRQFKEEGFNDISDSEIMKLVEESLALRKERERAEPFVCPKCGNTGLADSGGVQPWGEPIFIDCDCRYTSNTLETDTTSQQFESLAGKAVYGWIACSERMPEHGVDVQIFCSDTKEQFVGFRCIGGNDFQYGHYEGVAIVCSPSHWQPLPEPPCK